MSSVKEATKEQRFRQFSNEVRRSKTLRIAVKKCAREASSTSVFLYSLFESMFCGGSTTLFQNVHWSNVSKTDEFQNWAQSFVSSSRDYRKAQIDAFEKLRPVLSKFLIKGGTVSSDDLEGIEARIVDQCTEPKKIVTGLRDFADMVSFLENITDDTFHSKKIKRQLTNLQSRINQLEN